MNGISDVTRLFVARSEFSQWSPLTEIMKFQSGIYLLIFFFFFKYLNSSEFLTRRKSIFSFQILILPPLGLCRPGLGTPSPHRPHPCECRSPLFPYAWMACRGTTLPFGMERQCQCRHLNFRCLCIVAFEIHSSSPLPPWIRFTVHSYLLTLSCASFELQTEL